MQHFRKHLTACMIRLLLSELLCLVLAFSFAILRASLLTEMLSLLCGMLAHIQLIGNCACDIADSDASHSHSEQHTVRKPILLAAALMLPAYLSYLILFFQAESILWLNLFPLLNAPFLPVYRLLIAGTEPFSAISQTRRILMLLPPLITGISFFAAYRVRLITRKARADAIRSRK